MAIESFAFAVAENILEKLASIVYQELTFAWGLKGELQKLEDILSTVKAVILDAEEQEAKNQEIRVWLAKLKDALYDAEDVLDEFECETQRREVLKLYGTTTKKVGRFFSSCNPFAFRFKMGHKIKQIRERLDEIARQRAQFHLNAQYENRHHMHREREMTHSYVQVSDIIGRDNDKENIMKFLLNPSNDRKISIIPIVGIGGLGKTALAKLVYNDERVEENFELKMWICVSEDFDIKILAEKIIKSATNGMRCSIENLNLDNLEMDQLQRMLRESIGDKKYLLILDDVWNDNPMKWNRLKELLCMGGNGSKILVTTRSSQVASIVGTTRAHELSYLSHDECMDLFAKFAFKEGQEKHYPNLLKIGDVIVKKCKGVPLAVKTLASLLFLKTDENYWKFIRENELWKLEQKEDGILLALRLSYEQLPSDLKRCFSYCSFYPKDREFSDWELTYFWMAHGLLQSRNENEELEDIGLRYFKELASRSFFQDFKEEVGFIQCRMHDLFHDLALSLIQDEYSIVTSRTRNISKSVRHLLCYDTGLLPEGVSMILRGLGRARTLVFMSDEEKVLNSQSMLDSSLLSFQYLRMLDVSRSKLVVPLERIGALKHLRLLHFHGNSEVINVPNSICKLQNLQALFLCKGIEKLPTDMRYLINLRFLQITTMQKCLSNKGIGCLKSLRFLIIDTCKNLEYLFEDLQGLTNLRMLCIWVCKNLICLPQSMKYLTSLKTLLIYDCEKLNLTMEEGKDNQDFRKFNIQRLTLKSLPELVHLPEWLLQGSTNTLQFLQLEACENLKELPSCLQNIKSLQELKVVGCAELIERCERQEDQEWSKIAHIPKIILNRDSIKSTDNEDGNDD